MALRRIFFFFCLSFLPGVLLNFTNFNLDISQLLGVYFWLGSLITGSFFGAYLFKKSSQESLLSFSIGLSLLFCSWCAWIFFHLVPVNLLPFLLSSLGLWSLYKLDNATIARVTKYNIYFVIIFWIMLILNSFHPEIYWGEKAMDLNLLNFMGRNESFPPTDPWASGHTMKYYYFGYFIFGKLGPPMGLLGQTSYHLSLATSAGLFFLAGIALMKSFGHRTISSIYGALLLLFTTSLGGWWSYFFEGKRGIVSFWASSRVFNNSGFAEYPIWSFLFGDLHSHLMSYAYFLFSLTLIVRVILGEKRRAISLSTFIFGFSWASLAALNTWDAIFLSALFFLLVLLSGNKIWKDISIPAAILFGGLCWSPILLSITGGKASALYLFKGEYNGIFNYFLHQGMWWGFIAIFLILIAVDKTKVRKISVNLFLAFFVLLLFTESFVFMDRINTIFKFGNHLFIFLGVITLSLYKDKKKFNILLYLFILVAISSSFQNQLGVIKYNAFGTSRPTLDGSLYLKKVASEDYKIINFLNREIDGTPLIMETYGKSFENNRARISTHTGLPTYLGWEGHVIVRGISARETLKRKKEIDALYNSIDAISSYEWLLKRGIHFVVVGGAEHAKYQTKGLLKFQTFVDLFPPLIQTMKGTKIYGVYRVGKKE